MKSPRSKQDSNLNRRANWAERRSSEERRNDYRVSVMQDDCRRGVPRRESDISGDASEGNVWWKEKK